MRRARPGSELEASEFCVSGTTKFWRRRKASWKGFVLSCWNPHPDPPPQAGEGKSHAPTLPSPASGGGKSHAPTLALPRKRGREKSCPHPGPPPQAGEGKVMPPPCPPPQAGEDHLLSRRGRGGIPAIPVPHHRRTRRAGARRPRRVVAETGN